MNKEQLKRIYEMEELNKNISREELLRLERQSVKRSLWTEEMLSHFPDYIRKEIEGPYPKGIGCSEKYGWYCILYTQVISSLLWKEK